MNWVDIIQCITTTFLLSSLSLPTFVKITYKVLEVCVHSSPSGMDCSHGNNCLTPKSTNHAVRTSICGPGPLSEAHLHTFRNLYLGRYHQGISYQPGYYKAWVLNS